MAQVAVTAPNHEAVSLAPIGELISTRNEPDQGGVICQPQRFDGAVSGGAAVVGQGEEKKVHRPEGKVQTYLHRLTCNDPPAGESRHIQVRVCVLQNSSKPKPLFY